MPWIVPPIVDPVALGIAAAPYALLSGALMRTSRKSVRFNRDFILAGVDGTQPAGTYLVETDEEPLACLLSTAYRRVSTWLILPACQGARTRHETHEICPCDLEEALARDRQAERYTRIGAPYAGTLVPGTLEAWDDDGGAISQAVPCSIGEEVTLPPCGSTAKRSGPQSGPEHR
jgi:hypothetical protein